MRFLKSAALGAALAFTVAGGAFAQEVTLRFHHFISNKGAVPAHFILPWAEKIGAV